MSDEINTKESEKEQETNEQETKEIEDDTPVIKEYVQIITETPKEKPDVYEDEIELPELKEMPLIILRNSILCMIIAIIMIMGIIGIQLYIYKDYIPQEVIIPKVEKVNDDYSSIIEKQKITYWFREGENNYKGERKIITKIAGNTIKNVEKGSDYIIYRHPEDSLLIRDDYSITVFALLAAVVGAIEVILIAILIVIKTVWGIRNANRRRKASIKLKRRV